MVDKKPSQVLDMIIKSKEYLSSVQYGKHSLHGLNTRKHMIPIAEEIWREVQKRHQAAGMSMGMYVNYLMSVAIRHEDDESSGGSAGSRIKISSGSGSSSSES